VGAVLVAIAVLSGLVLLLFVVPVEAAIRLEGIEAFKGQVEIRWLVGLVRFRIPIPGARRAPREPGTEPKGAKARAQRRRRGGHPDVLAVLGQAAFRRRVYRFVGDLVRAAHLRRLRLRVRLGLGDPADTGRLWAVAGPLNALATSSRKVDVRIEPEFADPALEFRFHVRLLVVPLQLLALAAAFALSPASIRAWRTLKGKHA